MSLRFTAPVALTAAGDKPRRLSIVAYTGGVMRVSGFGPVVIDLAGLVLPASLPLLVDHRQELAGMVGTGTPTTDGKALTVVGPLADTGAAREVAQLLAGGHSLQASVGCEPTEVEYIRPGETVAVNGRTIRAQGDGFRLARRCELREVSIVPIGADGSTSVSLAARAAGGLMFKSMLKAAKTGGNIKAGKYTAEEVDKMTEDEAKAALKECMADDPPPDEENPAEAAALVTIMAGCSTELQIRAARERWSENRCRAEALTHIRASRPGAGVGGPAGGYGGTDHAEGDHLTAALLVRAGHEKLAEKSYGARVMEQSRPLHRAPVREIMAHALRAAGIDPGPNRDFLIRASGPSTAAISTLLSNTANKILEMTWKEAPATWRGFAAVKSAADFKTNTSLRPTFSGNLSQTGPGGEVKHGTISESYFEWAVYQFAKQYQIGRMHIINDDLGALADAVPSFARAAARTLNDLVYAVLLGNAGSFFAAGNGNVQTGAGSALDAASLGTAIKQMRLQQTPEGGYADISPAVLVVPPSLEQTARELIASTTVYRDQSADRQPDGNPLQNIAALEVEPRLQNGVTNPVGGAAVAGSTTAWYLFAAPANLPLVVGFLNGAEAPQIHTIDIAQNPNELAMILRVVHDFGSAFGDYRAAQKSAGA